MESNRYSKKIIRGSRVKPLKSPQPELLDQYFLFRFFFQSSTWFSTSFPGFSPTRPTEREREKPWTTLVTCLPESGRLKTNDLGEGQVSVRFVSTDRRQVSAAMKLCT